MSTFFSLYLHAVVFQLIAGPFGFLYAFIGDYVLIPIVVFCVIMLTFLTWRHVR